MNQKVSIIIPLYNAAAYIRDTLNSCLSQNYKNIEVVVVENGSIDNSFHIVQSIRDDRLQVFQITTNSAAAARNYGFKKSTGDYIMFLDADDMLSSNKVELQINALAQKPAGYVASCAWAKFTTNIEEAQIKEQPVWKVQKPVDWCVSSWTGGGMMIPGCWLIPRQVIKKAGLWDERLTLHDDGEFMCRVLLASNGNIFAHNTVVYYRQLEGSLSRQNHSLEAAKSALEVCKSYNKAILAVKDSLIIRQALAYNYRNFIYQFYPHFKHLVKEAQTQLAALHVTPLPIVGGEHFKRWATFIGFNKALYLKSLGRAMIKAFPL